MAQNVAPMNIDEVKTTQTTTNKPKTTEKPKTIEKPEEKPKTITQPPVQKPKKPALPVSQSVPLDPPKHYFSILNKPKTIPDVRIYDSKKEEDEEEVEEDNHFCDDEAEEDNRPEDDIENDCLSYVQEKPAPVSLCLKCFHRKKKWGILICAGDAVNPRRIKPQDYCSKKKKMSSIFSRCKENTKKSG